MTKWAYELETVFVAVVVVEAFVLEPLSQATKATQAAAAMMVAKMIFFMFYILMLFSGRMGTSISLRIDDA